MDDRLQHKIDEFRAAAMDHTAEASLNEAHIKCAAILDCIADMMEELKGLETRHGAGSKPVLALRAKIALMVDTQSRLEAERDRLAARVQKQRWFNPPKI